MTRKYSCHSRWLRLTQPAIEMLEQDLRNVAQQLTDKSKQDRAPLYRN